MSTSKYRLAAPLEHSRLVGSHRFDSSRILTASRRPTTVYDAKTNKTTVHLLDDSQTASITRPRWWLVLPTVLLSTFASATDLLLINDFLTHRYEIRYGLDASQNAERTACRQSMTSTTPAIPYGQFLPFAQQSLASQNRLDYSLVQRDTANFNIKNSFATIIPGLIMLTLLGSNCDLIGRRPVMLLPYLGKVLRYTLQLIIISLNLSDVWLLAAHALEAAFGSHGLITLSAFAYITDCTNDSTRTRAFLLTEVSIIVTRILPMVLMSFLLRRSHYMLPTSISLGLSVIGVAYVLLVQPESMDSV